MRNCPFCNETANLENKIATKEFKKEKFNIREFYYKCNSCNEEFSTTWSDEITINQVYNQYREKHKVLFPEELEQLRSKYGLSAQRMSLILGLGVNTYSNYEKGEVPSLSNSKLINSARKPQIFKEYIDDVKDKLSDKEYIRINKTIQEQLENNTHDVFACNFSWINSPNKYTGYASPNKEKISNLILYLIDKNKPDFNDKLKLNKMLFYCDFINYKNTGKSITGLAYRAIPYGPVPSNYDFIFAFFIEIDKIIEPEFIESYNARVIECYKGIKKYELSIFSDEEITTINSILKSFKDMSSWDLVEFSHNEKAWKDLNSSREIISYQDYSFDTNLPS